MTSLSLNQRSLRRLLKHQSDFDLMEVHVLKCKSGATLYDFGSRHIGTLAGGLLLARICLADLAKVTISSVPLGNGAWPAIQVTTDQPCAACLGSQFAGWPITGENYFAMGSGPGRVRRGKEPILQALGMADHSEVAVLVLESATMPSPEIVRSLAAECHVDPSGLHVAVARTASLAGLIQIVARSIETAMHKLFELGFEVKSVRSGFGIAPLPPVAKNDLDAMGWSNDSILYGAQAYLAVDSKDELLESYRNKLASDTSPDFGAPFREIFERYGRDFYKIDKLLFSPAMVNINNLSSGKVFSFGRFHKEILLKSFGIADRTA